MCNRFLIPTASYRQASGSGGVNLGDTLSQFGFLLCTQDVQCGQEMYSVTNGG